MLSGTLSIQAAAHNLNSVDIEALKSAPLEFQDTFDMVKQQINATVDIFRDEIQREENIVEASSNDNEDVPTVAEFHTLIKQCDDILTSDILNMPL
ncbi:hypothetical protein WDU94_005890 [Cyamophila willieti]